MIHPIYAPLKYCNLRYSMRCIFKLIFFCSSSKTKIWSSGISKWGGFQYVFPLEIIFIFITQKGGSRTPGTLPWLRPCIEQYLLNPLQVPGVIESRSTWLCCIKKSMSFTLCGESCDCRANMKAAETQFNYSFHHVHNTVVNTFSYGALCVLSMVEIWHVPIQF